MDRFCALALCLSIASCDNEIKVPAGPPPKYFPFNESQFVEIWIEADDKKTYAGDIWNSSLNYCVRDAQEPDSCGLRRVPVGYSSDVITIGDMSEDPDDRGLKGGCTAPDDGDAINDIVVGVGCRIAIKDALPNEYFEVIINNEPKSAFVEIPATKNFELNKSGEFATFHVGAGESAKLFWEKPSDLEEILTSVRLWMTIDDPEGAGCDKLADSWGGVLPEHVDDDGDYGIEVAYFPSIKHLPNPYGCQVRIKASRMSRGVNPLGEITGRQTDSKLIQVMP